MENYSLQNNMKIIFSMSLLALMLIASGCKKDTTDQDIDLGYDYFPNMAGTFIEYEVDSIHYGIDVDTVHFYLREELVNQFVGRIRRYVKTDALLNQHRCKWYLAE